MKAKTKKALLTVAKIAGSCVAVGTASILGAVVFDGSTKTLTDKLNIDAENKQREYDYTHNVELRKRHWYSKSYEPYNTRTQDWFNTTGEV